MEECGPTGLNPDKILMPLGSSPIISAKVENVDIKIRKTVRDNKNAKEKVYIQNK